MLKEIEIPDCYYRISVKALILDEHKRFMLCKDSSGKWELPGGGLDHGESIKQGIKREIREEMGLEVTFIADIPAYVFTVFCSHENGWICNIVYETQLENYNFTPTDECLEYRFFNSKKALQEPLFDNVTKFVEIVS